MARRILHNARDRSGRRIDVAVDESGTIVDVRAAVSVEPGDEVLDLNGWLLVPSLVEPHAHLDKALTADKVPNPRGDLMGAIDAWIDAASRGVFGLDEMTERGVRTLERLLFAGVTHVRTHVNVGDGDPEFVHLRAVRAAADEMRGLVDVQLVALMHSPLAGAEGSVNRRMLAQALDIGVDLVGGCPHLEEDGVGMIDVVLDAAADAGVGLDLHVDETLDPSMTRLVDLARLVSDRGFDDPVTASHCVSLSMQSPAVQEAVARSVAEARIAVVSLPQTNLFLQGWDHPTAMPRGIAPIDVLRRNGVVVAAGGDNVQDPFNPMGRCDPLETAALLVMASHQRAEDAFSMVTDESRRVLGLPLVDVQVGRVADVVAVDATSVREMLAEAPVARRVFRSGREVAVTTTSRRILRDQARPR
jgi:cytosine deaminase